MEAVPPPVLSLLEVEMNENIGDLKKILSGTRYEKSTKCIADIFDHYGVTTLGQLDNGPRIFGTLICGHSMWELMATIREGTLNPPPEVVKIPKTKAKPRKAKPVEKAPVAEASETKEIKE